MDERLQILLAASMASLCTLDRNPNHGELRLFVEIPVSAPLPAALRAGWLRLLSLRNACGS
jgi:hypothetical protein